MKTNYTKSEEYAYISPLLERICACGCGVAFIPIRKDKKYLNTKHQNYHYNRTKRKKPDIRENTINQILKNNDRILSKFFEKFNDGRKAIVPFKILQLEDFDNTRFVGEDKVNGQTIFYSYNFTFYFDKENPNKITINKI